MKEFLWDIHLMNYSNELIFSIFSQFQITPVIKMEEEGVRKEEIEKEMEEIKKDTEQSTGLLAERQKDIEDTKLSYKQLKKKFK